MHKFAHTSQALTNIGSHKHKKSVVSTMPVFRVVSAVLFFAAWFDYEIRVDWMPSCTKKKHGFSSLTYPSASHDEYGDAKAHKH
jgi:hypothetical protein